MIVNEKSKDSCATIIQNFTPYPATLPRGIIGYIEIPITQTTSPHYRVNDVNSLIHTVIHAYHPDKKFNFEYSDLTDTENVNLCNILIDNQNCYAKHKNDVGKISTPFRIRIKDNCKLHTQRPSKVPIHYRDRLNKLLLELEKYNIIKQIGSTTDEKHTIGTTFLTLYLLSQKETQ